MAELKYSKEKPYTFEHRLAMCEKVAINEGTELGDILTALNQAARSLRAFNDIYSEMVLLISEKLCTEYIKDYIWAKQCDWEEYDECNPEVYAHFTGGARKLTYEEFH
jgi:hypothetical protein